MTEPYDCSHCHDADLDTPRRCIDYLGNGQRYEYDTEGKLVNVVQGLTATCELREMVRDELDTVVPKRNKLIRFLTGKS